MLEQLHDQPPEMLPLHQDDFLEPLRDQIDAAEQVAEVADAAEPIVFAPLLGEQRQTQLVLACQCPSAELGEESRVALAVFGKTNVHLKDA